MVKACAFFVLFFIGCNEATKNEPFKTIEKIQQDDGITKEVEEEQVTEIERLIDITFDDPKQVVLQPDSFINQLKSIPNSTLGKESYALLLLNIGYVLRESGSILASIRFYERAFDYCTVNQLNQPDLVLYVAKPLANLYTRIDDVEKSISLHEKAIKIAEEKGQIDHLPGLYNNLAIAYEQKNDVDRVLKISRKGMSYTQAGSIHLALLCNALAKSYLETNQIDSASYFNENALRLFQTYQLKEDTLIWFGAALKMESDIAVYQGNFSKATRSLSNAIDLTESYFPHSKQREKAKYRVARGALTINQNPRSSIVDFQFAKNLLALDSLSSNVSDYTFTHALHGLAKAYSDINPDSALYYYRSTIENDYKTQQLIVSKASNYKNSKWNRGVLKEYVGLLAKRYQNEQEKETLQSLALQLFWAIELSKGRQVQREINRSQKWLEEDMSAEGAALRAELQVLHQQLSASGDEETTQQLARQIADLSFQFQLSEKYFEQTFQTIDFDQLADFLLEKSKTTSLVSYFIQNDGESYAVCINDEVAVAYIIEDYVFKNLNATQFISDYFGDNPYAYENNPDQYIERAQGIAQALMPFMDSVKEDLILSPDGLLFKLPMDALIHQDKFIMETKTLSYTYSFVLNFLYQSQDTYKSDVLLFAKSKHNEGFRDLDFVENEKKEIGRFSGEIFDEEEATVQAFINQLDNKDVLHLATHAVSDREPYIVFESRLTLDGLSVVAMQSPLVVLSACESAGGEIIQAEGLESLNKAFISKGVKGVIAAQWPVDDQSVAKLMGMFYEELYQGMSPIKALTRAKRVYIDVNEPVYKNPWYWASMNYVGIETQIQLEKKTTMGGRWMLFLVLLVLALFVLYKKHKKRLGV